MVGHQRVVGGVLHIVDLVLLIVDGCVVAGGGCAMGKVVVLGRDLHVVGVLHAVGHVVVVDLVVLQGGVGVVVRLVVHGDQGLLVVNPSVGDGEMVVGHSSMVRIMVGNVVGLVVRLVVRQEMRLNDMWFVVVGVVVHLMVRKKMRFDVVEVSQMRVMVRHPVGLGQRVVGVRVVRIRVERVVAVQETVAVVRVAGVGQGHDVRRVCRVPRGEGLREAEVGRLFHGEGEDVVVGLVRGQVVQGGALRPRPADLHPVHVPLKVGGKVHHGGEAEEALGVLEAGDPHGAPAGPEAFPGEDLVEVLLLIAGNGELDLFVLGLNASVFFDGLSGPGGGGEAGLGDVLDGGQELGELAEASGLDPAGGQAHKEGECWEDPILEERKVEGSAQRDHSFGQSFHNPCFDRIIVFSVVR